MISATSKGLRTSDYDYALPPERIARYPAARRDDSRLLVVQRETRGLQHRGFRDIVELVQPGDVFVLNESRVFPARLVGRKPTGAPSEILLLRPVEAPDQAAGSLWEALVRPGGKLKPGRRVLVAADLEVEIRDSTPGGGRIVRLKTTADPYEAIQRHGHVPLPPYLQREDEPIDRERYQTVYARATGSVAAPTAGLHFTSDLLDEIQRRGVRAARIVLHIGIGTFRPVESEDPAQHSLQVEPYEVSAAAADTINAARHAGDRIWGVGTTVARVLETVADARGTIHPGRGETALFIRPPYRFRALDCMLTNFHLPRSTLLMLVAAFAGYDLTMAAYREAVAGGYRFYSYGDAMAIV